MDFQKSPQPRPKKSTAGRQALFRSGELRGVIGQHAVKDPGMGVIRRDLYIRQGHQAEPRILDFQANQLGEVTLNLIRYSMAALGSSIGVSAQFPGSQRLRAGRPLGYRRSSLGSGRIQSPL